MTVFTMTFLAPIQLISASTSASPLLPIRVLAGVALVAVIVAFIYVGTHLRKIEDRIAADKLVPDYRGARNNMVLMVCAIPIIVVSLLLFLLLKS